MITCDLIGRLGNQMFQIATTAAHAWRVGKPFAFPDRAQGSYTGETYFNHLPKVNPRRVFPIYRERSHRYTPIPENLTDVKLSGYWQSEKYFKEYREQIIDLFNCRLSPTFSYPYGCAVHIRLGDYKEFKDKHPPVTSEYISKAMEHVWEKTSGNTFFIIYSDEPKEAFNIVIQTAFFQKFKNGKWTDIFHLPELSIDPLVVIRMNSALNHHIISNSSFSWWIAWLCQHNDKIVIAPKVWFGPGNSHLDSTDIYCENWIKI